MVDVSDGPKSDNYGGRYSNSGRSGRSADVWMEVEESLLVNMTTSV
jgi:hypothetical protein